MNASTRSKRTNIYAFPLQYKTIQQLTCTVVELENLAWPQKTMSMYYYPNCMLGNSTIFNLILKSTDDVMSHIFATWLTLSYIQAFHTHTYLTEILFKVITQCVWSCGF